MEQAQKLKILSLRLRALTIFRGLHKSIVVSRLIALLDEISKSENQAADLYCDLVAAIYEGGGDLGELVKKLVLENENPAISFYLKNQPLPAQMTESLDFELETLDLLSRIKPDALSGEIHSSLKLPSFTNTYCDFKAVYHEYLNAMSTRGYGIFTQSHMLTLDNAGNLAPVKNPDPQRLDELSGYEREREQILINTRALLTGLSANNVLLYGDAGTGKSSSVKAICNQYREEGLRLIEIQKSQLYHIPTLMDKLAENPLKFILFIDDLSFPADDADFTALKAILEGNVSVRPKNIVIYATSNRRHMVKERMADRQGGEVHLSDTLEEESSLAARFGLTITFLKPDKDLYLSIVKSLAAEYSLETPIAQLLPKAEAHAIRHGGRSPRVAKQFIEFTQTSEKCRSNGGETI